MKQLLGVAPATASPSPVYLGENTILLRTAHPAGRSYKLYVDTRDVSLTPHLITDGVWEPSVSRVLEQHVKPGMRVVEVGANVGFHTLHLASLVGAKGYVMAFEANPRLVDLLARSVEVNGLRDRVSIKGVAAADREGQAEFKVFAKHLGSSSFVVADGTAEDFHDTITKMPVVLTTLDSECAEWPCADFIKIDAEGAEPMVLAGAAALLARSRRIRMLLEFGPAFFGSRANAEAFIDGLAGDGFSIERLSANGTLGPVSRAELLDPTKLEELLVSRGH